MLRFLSRKNRRNGQKNATPLKKDATRTPSNKNCVQCRVLMLDGTDLSIDLTKKAVGSDLYEQVFYSLDLIEKDYFGLQFTDANNVQMMRYERSDLREYKSSDPKNLLFVL
ncbi:hypothetical protein GE061_016306 [Apolygus lucorum]|uniref:FERM domain-containing protein n=1 Tax=Apolygus lucorum TaxID=248454 RepID=A0A8S9XFU5_APOLU|nr:hypothetical protein GE061_016306 [Apolygus lucorum]